MIKNIIFDFDGVIIDSMSIRSDGFRNIFSKFKLDEVNKLIQYHHDNGGLSRYVKIRYFFENILHSTITEDKVNFYANCFSKLMLEKLSDKMLLINDSVSFIKKNDQKYNMHIASGSDEKELKMLCHLLNIDSHFATICGSPTKKNDIVKHIVLSNEYKLSETALIGDSINDYQAAKDNNIIFYAYNNPNLKQLSNRYLESFSHFHDAPFA